MFKMSIIGDSKASTSKSPVCFLPISVGQPYHEGTEWDETITLINASFEACVIVVVDELHRFTEKMRNSKLTDEQASNQALQNGQDWITDTNEQWQRKKNKKRSNGFHPGLTIPYTITRWSEWTSLDGYQAKKADIDAMYENKDELDFHTYVDVVRLTFINGFRRSQEKIKSDKIIRFDLDAAQDLCKRYLLEELAVVSMWRDKIFPDLAGIPLSLLEGEAPFCMAYPFGYNSTNKDVFNCFEYLCAEKLTLLNLHKETKPKNRSGHLVPGLELSSTSSEKQSLVKPGQVERKPKHVFVTHEEIQDGINYMQGGSPSLEAARKDLAVAPFLAPEHSKAEELPIDGPETDEKVICDASSDKAAEIETYPSKATSLLSKKVGIVLISEASSNLSPLQKSGNFRSIHRSASGTNLAPTKQPPPLWEKQQASSPLLFTHAGAAAKEKSNLPSTPPRKGSESPW